MRKITEPESSQPGHESLIPKPLSHIFSLGMKKGKGLDLYKRITFIHWIIHSTNIN